MSQPILSGEQLTVEVRDGAVRVTNDPGFTSDNGDGCPYRAVWVLDQQGTTMYGSPVAAKTAPAARWTGFYPTRQALADARIPVTKSGSIRVYAGTLFEPWVPGQEGPFIEWGYTDQGKNPTGVPRANDVAFIVSAPVPPAENFALQAQINFAASSIGRHAITTWRTTNPAEGRRYDNGDSNPDHYNSRFGKFMVYLRKAAA